MNILPNKVYWSCTDEFLIFQKKYKETGKRIYFLARTHPRYPFTSLKLILGSSRGKERGEKKEESCGEDEATWIVLAVV